MTADNSNLPSEITPRPDPTTLTTAQLIREIMALRQLIEARLEALDGRIDLVRVHLDRVPIDIKDATREVMSVTEKSFTGALVASKELRDAQHKALDSKINEIRDRLSSLEQTPGSRKDVIITGIVVMVAIWAALVSFVRFG